METAKIEPQPTKEKSRRPHQHIEITDRDWRLFQVLKRVRCLGQKQIEALLKSYGGTYRKRLLHLSRAGYLQKLIYGRRGGVYGVAWTTGRKLRRDGAKPFSSKNIFELDHQLGLTQLYLDLISSSPPIERELAWHDGIYTPIEAYSKMIMPDATLKIWPKQYVVFIEYDRSTKSLKRLEQQLRRYRDYLYSPSSDVKEQVWFITKSWARTESLLKIRNKVALYHDKETRMLVLPASEIVHEVQRRVWGTDAWQLKAMQQKVIEPPKPQQRMIPVESVKQFIEEAVSMFYHQRLRLPASYKSAAKALYP